MLVVHPLSVCNRPGSMTFCPQFDDLSLLALAYLCLFIVPMNSTVQVPEAEPMVDASWELTDRPTAAFDR